MRIHTIRVEGFKRFRDAFTLDQLIPGINLIAAPNGRGKSTLAEAVRVAFMERHRTASLGETLAPWSQPGATPSVQIEFEREGRRHTLSKTFGSRKSCSLQVQGGGAWNGEEAEQQLADLFSFSYSGKGASKAEHRGVPGLLWVQQGTAGQIAEPVEHAQTYISRALGREMGELAATAGDRVIERVRSELQVLLTRGGKPTGEYAELVKEQQQCTDRLEQLQAAIREYEAAVDAYAQLKAQHAGGEQDRPWERQRAQAAAASARLKALDDLERQRRELQLRQEMVRGRIDECGRKLAAFDEEEQAAAQRQAELEQAVLQDERTLAAVKSAEAALREARAADDQARHALARARQADTRRHHQQSLAAATALQLELQQRLEQVTAHQAELAVRQAEAARLAGFAGAGRKLQQAEAAAANARARLDAVATRIEYQLHGEGVQLDGQMLSGTGARTAVEPVEITLAQLGRIRILPGAKDLSQLKADAERAALELQALLQSLGAATADEARQGERSLAEAQAGVQGLHKTIGALAPKGVEALRADAGAVAGEVQRHRDALAVLPAVGEGEALALPAGAEDESLALPAGAEDESLAVPAGAEDDALAVPAAEQREQLSRQALEKAQARSDTARAEANTAIERLRLARQEHAAAQARLQAPGRDERRRGLQQDLVTQRAELQAHDEQAEQLRAQIAAEQPEQLRLDIQRWTTGAAALEAAHIATGARLQELAGELKAKGALGLQEDAAAVREHVGRLTRQVAERRRRAAALAHLLQVLQDQRAEVARSIRAPLQRHLNHYLAIQFPGTSIELDEQLRPVRITRQGPFGSESGGFEELSGGEREQLGIIARLAYADLLKEAGKPTLLMLDDSLVNSDAERLGRMKRVLYDAGQRHQILIFTCHQEDWLDLGVVPRGLQ
jgi:hypothetical protein